MYGVTVTYTQNNFLNDCTAIYMTMTVFWKGKQNFMYGIIITYTQINFLNDHTAIYTTMTVFQKGKKIHVELYNYL